MIEVTIVEEFFITVYRNFSFLREYNYEGKEFCSRGKEIWVSFNNQQIHREIIVIMEEPFVLNVYFVRKKLLTIDPSSAKFSLCDYYEQLGAKYLEKTNDVKTISAFIKEHLTPIVKGEKWIDEIIKERK